MSNRKEIFVLRPNVRRTLPTQILAGAALFLSAVSASNAQSSYDPPTNQTFEQVTSSMKVLQYYSFGTNSGNNVTNITQLAQSFEPYGIAGNKVINLEWENYQPFNYTNFVFGPSSLNLTATLAGGLYPGGINSGQIWTKQTFKPNQTGYQIYGFCVRMKIPAGVGMWPAAWLYSAYSGDASEIDIAEFQNMYWQNQYDWTGYDHGPGAGSDIYSIKTNQWVWQPGTDFSASFHDYEMIWTPDATYKYVDGRLIEAQRFTWTAAGPAQVGINLAVGSNLAGAVGLQPNSTGEFPSSLQVQYFAVWGK